VREPREPRGANGRVRAACVRQAGVDAKELSCQGETECATRRLAPALR
jgi:hypothetical protein